ncbi:hypothetical protein EBB07_10080 [Paenibacillaceae bacterium]|nr:hypothetical protein EBB07_10080 [Paenibacillaceae bacterium]
MSGRMMGMRSCLDVCCEQHMPFCLYTLTQVVENRTLAVPLIAAPAILAFDLERDGAELGYTRNWITSCRGRMSSGVRHPKQSIPLGYK